jgi:hypothetical protein
MLGKPHPETFYTAGSIFEKISQKISYLSDDGNPKREKRLILIDLSL